MIDPTSDYPELRQLSKTLDAHVWLIPDGHGTCSDGTDIFIESHSVMPVLKLAQTRKIGLRAWPAAQGLYFMLHEHGHVLLNGKPYEGTKTEIACNKHAAAFFRPYCLNKLGLTKRQTTRLWKALPDYYRDPQTV